jgi:exoribonuclease-2
MHVFFEDDGAFKAGTVLADNDASLQVESVSGKRVKVKASNVLLRFAEPAPAAMLADAQRLAAELDPNFLWEASDGREFAFADLAGEYYGRAPTPAEAAALAICLHASPMHFYKKGKGRYKAAPGDALKAALAGVARKLREADQVAACAPVQTGQTRGGDEVARCRMRGASDQSAGAAVGLRCDPLDA